MSDLTFDRNPDKWDNVSKAAKKILEARRPKERPIADVMSDIRDKIMGGLKKSYEKDRKATTKQQKSQVKKAHEVFGKDTMGFFSSGHNAKKPDTNPHAKSRREVPAYKEVVKQEKIKKKQERQAKQIARASKPMKHVKPANLKANWDAREKQRNINKGINDLKLTLAKDRAAQHQKDMYGKKGYGAKHLYNESDEGAVARGTVNRRIPSKIDTEKLRQHLENNPKARFIDVAQHFNTDAQNVAKWAKRIGMNRKPKGRIKKEPESDLRERSEHWMQHLHIKKGALTAKANKAGEGVQEFAHEHAKDKGRTGRQSRLALVFAKARHHKKKKKQ